MKMGVEETPSASGMRARVTFTGLLTEQAKLHLMASARVVAIPSYGENFCRSGRPNSSSQ